MADEPVKKENEAQFLIDLAQGDLIDTLEAPSGEEVEWIWKGYLARGLRTEIAAFWKAGKSVLISLLLKALTEGEAYCGQDTQPTRVYVLSEEPKITWIKRRTALNLTNFFVRCKPLNRKLTRKEWERYIEEIGNFCTENDVGLVIFDTLSEFWPVTKEEDNAEIKDALRPINGLTEKRNLSVLLIHHSNRQGSREGGMGRGGGALPADMDIIIDFLKYDWKDDFDRRRILKGGLSRWDETPKSLTIELSEDKTHYETIGSTKSNVEFTIHINTLKEMLKKYTVPLSILDIQTYWPDEGKIPSGTSITRWTNALINSPDPDYKIIKYPGKGKIPMRWEYQSLTLLGNLTDRENSGTKSGFHDITLYKTPNTNGKIDSFHESQDNRVYKSEEQNNPQIMPETDKKEVEPSNGVKTKPEKLPKLDPKI